jgi:hypothetical protein
VDVVGRVKRVVDALRGRGEVHLVVDATGVGAPVIELLQRSRLGCRLWPVTITGGDGESREKGLYRVPKRDLVVGLQVLLEQGGIQMAEGLREKAVLVKELADMRVKLTSSGHAQYEGRHDDLVSALSLACWGVRKMDGR